MKVVIRKRPNFLTLDFRPSDQIYSIDDIQAGLNLEDNFLRKEEARLGIMKSVLTIINPSCDLRSGNRGDPKKDVISRIESVNSGLKRREVLASASGIKWLLAQHKVIPIYKASS